ncbi:MAG: NfeD family protein [Saccharofermentanales bacterium]
MAFWENFTLIEKIFIFIATPSTILLLIQLVLQLIGLGGDSGAGQNVSSDVSGADSMPADMGMDTPGIDGDVQADGMDSDQAGAAGADHPDVVESTDLFSSLKSLRIFTFQGFVAFFAISGWTGLLFLRVGIHVAVAIFLAFLCGLIAMTVLALLLRAFMNLQSDGTVQLRNALGAQGEVYLRIPAAGQGKGKVSILIQERYCEFDAITYENDPLPTSSVVRVVDIVSNEILVVEKVD